MACYRDSFTLLFLFVLLLLLLLLFIAHCTFNYNTEEIMFILCIIRGLLFFLFSFLRKTGPYVADLAQTEIMK
jgi:hypothetical protein